MAPPRSILIIVNPASGRGRAARRADELAAIFRKQGARAEVRPTEGRGHAAKIVAEAARRTEDPWDAICACGGDGTVHEVAAALANARKAWEGPVPSLALAPAGRCNDFARALGIRPRPKEIAAAVLKGATRGLDLGVVNGRYFCTIATAGVDARISDFVDGMRMPLRGTLAYLYGALRVLARATGRRMTVEGDFGRLEGPFLVASAANTGVYGGGIRLVPHADAADGLLDVCLIGAMTRRRIATLLPRVLAGQHAGQPEVRFFKTRRLTIHVDPPADIWADGERLSSTPAVFEVAASAIRVFA